MDRELLTNVALRVEETSDADVFRVSGRGELHLTILLENMRREGYEIAVGKPRVVFKEIDGVKSEPYEFLTVDIDNARFVARYSSTVKPTYCSTVTLSAPLLIWRMVWLKARRLNNSATCAARPM